MKNRSGKILGTGILVTGLATTFAANADHNTDRNGDEWIFAVGTALTLAHYYDHDRYYPRHAYHRGYNDRRAHFHKRWRKSHRRAHRKAHRHARRHAHRHDHYGSARTAYRRSDRHERRDHYRSWRS